MDLKKTPFYQNHLEAGARMVDFGGWALPLEYKSILSEAMDMRRHCGLFDASHMGEIIIKGKDAFSFLQEMATNDLSLIKEGQMQYNLFLNPQGGVLDDLMVYHRGESFLCVVNAANIEKIFNWLKANQRGDVEIIDESNNTALLSLQGPKASLVMEKILKSNLDGFKYMTFLNFSVEGRNVLISRSGYTGEDGFEIYLAPNDAHFWWDIILKAGREHNLQLCGLGARDILRVEAGYPLYGHEINEVTSPYAASLRWAVKRNKNFIGKDSLIRADSGRIRDFRVGFIMEEKAMPRQGYNLYYNGASAGDRKVIGRVSSGIYSPNADKFIGMAFVDKEFAAADTPVQLGIREKFYRARIVRFPFVEIRTHKSYTLERREIA